MGAERHQRPHTRRAEHLANSSGEWLRKRAVPRPSTTAAEAGLAGMAELRRLFPGGGGRRRKAVDFPRGPVQL